MVTFMLHSLCKHPEYLECLRKEVEAMSEHGLYGANNDDTPLMDSFLKESARLNPLRTCKQFFAHVHSSHQIWRVVLIFFSQHGKENRGLGSHS